MGLRESFWGYKEYSAPVAEIPKDEAHASDRLVLRTSSGRGGLKSSSKSLLFAEYYQANTIHYIIIKYNNMP